MIDVHSHITFDIDDGCRTLEESLKVINNLKELGFSKIVLTPHYLYDSKYCANNKIKLSKLNDLKKEVKKNNINIDLYLGNEIYINFHIEDLIKQKEIYPMNNTKYLLIELSMYNEINEAMDYLYELRLKGYIPVIAHPERYRYFQRNYQKMDELYESGVLFQCNYGSIIGQYGKDAQKLLKYALKKDMVTFMGTDIHRPDSLVVNSFDKAVRKLKKIVGDKKFKEITESNALKMINGKEIEYK